MPLQNTVEIKPANIIQDKFIPATIQESFANIFKKFRENKVDPSDFWATLGRQDNGTISQAWTGSIVCSTVGSNSFTNRGRQIREEAEQLAALYGGPNPDSRVVTEKFISLRNLRFTINDVRARMMRLTVSLNPGEHALVFLQHTDLNDTKYDDGLFEYLFPEKEELMAGRKLVTYFFEMPAEAAAGQFQTVIKALCYKSPVSVNMAEADAQAEIRDKDTKYAVQLFKTDTNNFRELSEAEVTTEVQRDKKTLLLIHGTFSTTEGSYGFLYDVPGAEPMNTDRNWLKQQILSKKYEQVIGFDHPSVVDSPGENAAKLISLLAPGGKFTKTVDIITTSRGGLVGKNLVNDKQQTVMTIERVATVACANGVQWMTTGEGVGRIVGVIRKATVGPVAKSALVLVQLGIKIFLNQPGLKAMKKGEPSLVALLNDKPANPDMRYLPLCGNYDPKNTAHPAGWRIFDLLLDAALHNKNHDWVVETDFQVIMPDGFVAYQQPISYYRGIMMDTTHTRYFFDPMNTLAKKRILYYLHDDSDVRAAKTLPADF